AQNKEYDRSTSATLNLVGAGLSTVVSGDVVTLTTATANAHFLDPNVGTNKTVTVSGFGILGPDAINYGLTQPAPAADITPAPAVVTLTGLHPTYDATAKSAGATTVPAGLSVSLTYNGSSTAPIDAGTYLVAATVTDPNYTGSTNDNLA